MNKILIIVLAIGFGFLGTGCVTTGPAKITDFQPISVAVMGADAKASIAKAKIKEAQKVAQKLPKSEDTKLLQLRLAEAEQQVTALQVDLAMARDEIKIATANNKAQIDSANATIIGYEETIKALESKQKHFIGIVIAVSVFCVGAWILGAYLKPLLIRIAAIFQPAAGIALVLTERSIPDWPFRIGAVALVLFLFIFIYHILEVWGWLIRLVT